MDIYLDKAHLKDKDILHRLLQYSLYEESLYDQNEMNEYALFDYEKFDCYFGGSDREAYFIREQDTDKLLGFVMIDTCIQKDSTAHTIKEFLVIPKYRKNKVGKKAAFACFDMYKGNWEVSPSFGSSLAHNFWKKVIDGYTGDDNNLVGDAFVFKND